MHTGHFDELSRAFAQALDRRNTIGVLVIGGFLGGLLSRKSRAADALQPAPCNVGVLAQCFKEAKSDYQLAIGVCSSALAIAAVSGPLAPGAVVAYTVCVGGAWEKLRRAVIFCQEKQCAGIGGGNCVQDQSNIDDAYCCPGDGPIARGGRCSCTTDCECGDCTTRCLNGFCAAKPDVILCPSGTCCPSDKVCTPNGGCAPTCGTCDICQRCDPETGACRNIICSDGRACCPEEGGCCFPDEECDQYGRGCLPKCPEGQISDWRRDCCWPELIRPNELECCAQGFRCNNNGFGNECAPIGS